MALNPGQKNFNNSQIKTQNQTQIQNDISVDSQPDISQYRAGIIRDSALLGLFLALFMVLSWLVFSSATTSLDKNTMNWAATTVNPGFDTILGFVTTMGGFGGVGVMSVLLGIFFLWRRQIRNLILLTFSVGGGMLLDSVLKIIFHRARPDSTTETANLTTFSYPSGHSVASACMCAFLIWLSFQLNWRPALRTALIIGTVLIVLLIGFSRVYLVEHYVTDVIGGWLLAAFWMLAVLGAGFKLFQVWQIRRLNQSSQAR